MFWLSIVLNNNNNNNNNNYNSTATACFLLIKFNADRQLPPQLTQHKPASGIQIIIYYYCSK